LSLWKNWWPWINLSNSLRPMIVCLNLFAPNWHALQLGNARLPWSRTWQLQEPLKHGPYKWERPNNIKLNERWCRKMIRYSWCSIHISSPTFQRHTNGVYAERVVPPHPFPDRARVALTRYRQALMQHRKSSWP
jgi:hypothetical protein